MLMQALEEQRMLAQAQSGHDATLARFRPIEQKMEDVSTSRFNKGLMGAGEAIYDAVRRKKVEPQYYEGLAEAMQSARGVDEIKAQLDMMAQVRAAEEERAYTEQQELAKHQRALDLQGVKDKGAMDRTQYRTANTPTPPNLSFTDIPGENGSSQKVAIDPKTGNVVRSYGSTPPKPTAADTEAAAKNLDIAEALTVLDDAEALLNKNPMFSGTGPIQGRLTGFTKWGQAFQSKADHMFAVAKRIYRSAGEGAFSNADAEALQGMLFSAARDEGVNKTVINALRKSLSSRSPSFKDFMAEVGATGGQGNQATPPGMAPLPPGFVPDP